MMGVVIIRVREVSIHILILYYILFLLLVLLLILMLLMLGEDVLGRLHVPRSASSPVQSAAVYPHVPTAPQEGVL